MICVQLQLGGVIYLDYPLNTIVVHYLTLQSSIGHVTVAKCIIINKISCEQTALFIGTWHYEIIFM